MSNATYKIRRLKWRRKPAENGWFADTSIVGYEIVMISGSWWVHVDGHMFRFNLRALREAKAACQEHFERNVHVFLVRVKQ